MTKTSFRQILFFLVYCSALLMSWCSCEAEPPRVSVQFQNSDGSSSPKIEAELAVTLSEKQLGLMYRKSLPETAGMLFIFRDEQPRSFWMKNTYLELDMIFLNKDFQVVSVYERAVPLTETARPSEGPAKFVLEVAGGKSKTWGIVRGSRAQIEGSLPVASD